MKSATTSRAEAVDTAEMLLAVCRSAVRRPLAASEHDSVVCVIDQQRIVRGTDDGGVADRARETKSDGRGSSVLETLLDALFEACGRETRPVAAGAGAGMFSGPEPVLREV